MDELKLYTQMYLAEYSQEEIMKVIKDSMQKNDIPEINLVVVNLYPFENTIKQQK